MDAAIWFVGSSFMTFTFLILVCEIPHMLADLKLPIAGKLFYLAFTAPWGLIGIPNFLSYFKILFFHRPVFRLTEKGIFFCEPRVFSWSPQFFEWETIDSITIEPLHWKDTVTLGAFAIMGWLRIAIMTKPEEVVITLQSRQGRSRMIFCNSAFMSKSPDEVADLLEEGRSVLEMAESRSQAA